MTDPLPIPTKDVIRFKTITTPCEWIERYRPGGFHPVHLNEQYNHGQYHVLRKLGDGSFSTVWLVLDTHHHRYAALKILTAEASKESNELLVLQNLRKTLDATQLHYITTLLDHFEHTGPNGRHLCLVFEAMGPSASSMVEDLPCYKPRTKDMKIRYPIWMAKRLLGQALQGLACLHSNNIIHGDFQPGNMLFTLKDLCHIDQQELLQDANYKWGSTSPPVERLDGREDKWAPRYLAVSQPLAKYADIGPDFRIKLSDFGASFSPSNPPSAIVTPLGLRAPEVVLGRPYDQSIDIWSFGCLVFEFITGRPLFMVPGSGNDDSDMDDHLLGLGYILGPIPDHLYCLWPRSSRYFNSHRVQFNSFISGAPANIDLLSARGVSLEEHFDSNKPADMSEAETRAVTSLLRRILRYNIAERPTADDILQDPWLTS